MKWKKVVFTPLGVVVIIVLLLFLLGFRIGNHFDYYPNLELGTTDYVQGLYLMHKSSCSVGCGINPLLLLKEDTRLTQDCATTTSSSYGEQTIILMCEHGGIYSTELTQEEFNALNDRRVQEGLDPLTV